VERGLHVHATYGLFDNEAIAEEEHLLKALEVEMCNSRHTRSTVRQGSRGCPSKIKAALRTIAEAVDKVV
jgi:hypothetical protein